MGFRRGSRSSRAKKQKANSVEQDQPIDVVENYWQEEMIQQELIRLSDADDEQYRYDQDLLFQERQQKAREKEQQRIKEEKEQRREALRRARRNQRREASNSKKREAFQKRHQRPAKSQYCLDLGIRLVDNPCLKQPAIRKVADRVLPVTPTEIIVASIMSAVDTVPTEFPRSEFDSDTL